MKLNKMITALAFFMLTAFSQVIARNTDDTITTLPVELKLVGTINDNPLLQLSFTGPVYENEFSISIMDETGFLLYSENAKGAIFSKKFLLNTEDLGGAVLRFVITCKKSQKTAVYQVSCQHRMVEQMDVVKL